jgi:RNA polymerase sigma-70 factor (ECF subfamily)
VDDPQRRRFEALALPHLDAAYNLARWLLRDEHRARDAVQEAYLRAFRFFDGLRGEDARPWLLGIVRNCCFTLLQGQGGELLEFDDERDGAPAAGAPDGNPAALLLARLDRQRVHAAISALPPVFREVIVLRELEDMSYEEIARIAGVPAGTVMSRLSRGRRLLRAALQEDR